MRFLVILVVTLSVGFCEEDESINLPRNPRDSYLDAYTDSHDGNSETVNSDRQYTEAQGYPFSEVVQNGPPTQAYGAPQPGPVYQAPQSGPVYEAPRPVYGAPAAPVYGAPAPQPAPVYGPPSPPQPAPVYGPPSAPAKYGPPAYPVPQYGPPAPVYGPPPFYGMPHGMLGILDKLKFKLDLFVLGKILLKLVIFKKIVSLIAILCLLLFIPSLKHHKDDDAPADDDEAMMRSFRNSTSSVDARINNVSKYVLDAIESFSKKQKKMIGCNSLYCKTSKILTKMDSKLSYKKLAKLYFKEME